MALEAKLGINPKKLIPVSVMTVDEYFDIFSNFEVKNDYDIEGVHVTGIYEPMEEQNNKLRGEITASNFMKKVAERVPNKYHLVFYKDMEPPLGDKGFFVFSGVGLILKTNN